MMRTALALLGLLFLTITPRAARAADPLEDFPDPAAAQNLFVEARTLIQSQRFAEACSKLEDGLRMEPGVAAQLELADCNEQLGKIATAWTGFLEAASRASVTNQHEREKLARKRARTLEVRLPKLVIEVPNASQGLEVKRDGVTLDAATWGKAIPVDPGSHRVTATAPGKKRWLVTVQSTEGGTTRVELPRELVAAPNAEPLPPVNEESAAQRRVLSWLVVGVGAIGLGVGSAFGLASLQSGLLLALMAPEGLEGR